jgi:hypothetical protein
LFARIIKISTNNSRGLATFISSKSLKKESSYKISMIEILFARHVSQVELLANNKKNSELNQSF